MQPRASQRPVVLIVEDEWLIRMNTMEALEAAGFEVVEAENADQAIAILTARIDINLVLTDVHRALPAEGDLPDGVRFVQKPYTARQITAVLRELFQ
jgi:CheY-like chemotaxis protein